MMDVQKLVYAMRRMADETRKDYHVLLGDLIVAMGAADPTKPVVFSDGGAPSRAHSYRGYYSDLAFQPATSATAGEVLAMARSALNQTFEGYKGGNYIMRADTPLWRASYGNTGEAIVAITVGPDEITLVVKTSRA